VCAWQLNAVNRLIYETSEKSKPRTTQFHVVREGTVKMAMTSAAERDLRDDFKTAQQLNKTQQEGTPDCVVVCELPEFCHLRPEELIAGVGFLGEGAASPFPTSKGVWEYQDHSAAQQDPTGRYTGLRRSVRVGRVLPPETRRADSGVGFLAPSPLVRGFGDIK